jgi:hypothetical protein
MHYNIYNDGIAEILPTGTKSSHNANVISSGKINSMVNEFNNVVIECENIQDRLILESYFN